MASLRLSIGNSSTGPVGFCARVKAGSREQALNMLGDYLESMSCEHTVEVVGQPAIEYIEIYFNPEVLSQADVDEVPEDEPAFTLANAPRKFIAAPQFAPATKPKQLPLIRGLNDERGQLELFDDMEVG